MSYSLGNEKELDKLTEQERELAIKILEELSQQGSSRLYNDLVYEDYTEVPVSIDTFLNDPQYLGSGLTNEEGRFTVFPYWVKLLNEVFPDNLTTAYRTLALTGAIGLGKTLVGVLCQLYLLYRMMCLKDPYLHYGLQPIDKITFAFMNITLDASKGVGWDKCQQLLQSSPWFLARGEVRGIANPTWYPPKGIELIAGSLPRHILGRALFGVFFDEISFIPNRDIEEQKVKAKELVEAASARMESRFMKGEHNPTLLTLASSKRTEQSYMETFIANKKKLNLGTTKVVDEPQWVIRTDKDSVNKFKVALGNKFLTSEVLPLDVRADEIKLYKDKGYKIIDIPMGYYETFMDDLNLALTDVAGISTSSIIKYISGSRLQAVKNNNLKNLFIKDIIEVGNAKDDTAQYWDYIDLTRLDTRVKSKPLYVHMDLSVSGDKTGIAGTWVIGKKPHQDGIPDNKELFFRLAFNVSVKAPKGYQISFEKNRQFIYWLKQQGFNVQGISTDSFQSVDTGQALSAKGYKYEMISVDRVDRESRTNKPYLYLRNTIYEERIEMYDSALLTDELLGLEKDSNGKVDHVIGGSKDVADGLCGCVWNASQNAEQYAFDYGETLDTIINVNNTLSEAQARAQVEVELQEELQQMFDPRNRQGGQSNNNNGADSIFKDFGLGPAQTYKPQYLRDGIVYW